MEYIIRDASGETPQNMVLLPSRVSGYDITSHDPDRISVMTSPPRESGRDITSDTDDRNNTDLGSAPREISQEIRWSRTRQVALLAMFALLFIGVLIAIGHHLFCSHLNNHATDKALVGQIWAIRIGTGFAYLFRTAMVAAVSVVYAQGFWFMVRQNAFSIGTLDDFFALLNNPFRFRNSNLYRRARLLFCLAIISWLIPISAVFAPGALSVISGQSISVTNTSVPVLAPLDNFFGLYLELPIIAALESMANRVLAGSQIVPWASPCGVNCSYTVSFLGPAYQCVDLGPFSSNPINFTALQLEDPYFYPKGPDMPSDVLNSSVLYYAFVDAGNETRPAGILIVYDSLSRTLRCNLYNATYTTVVSYVNNKQTIQNDIECHNLILNGSQLYATVGPALVSNGAFWGPMNLILLQSIAGGLLKGYLSEAGGGLYLGTSAVSWPALGQWSPGLPGTPGENIVFSDLATAVPNYIENFTLSLISTNIDTCRLANISSALVINTSVPATSTSYQVIYAYDPATLWAVYGCALGTTAFCVIVGSWMLHSNRVVGELTFAQVLVTTRNPTLDKISEEAGLGGRYITDQVRKVEVKYGLLEPEIGKMGFGMEDEIHSIG